MQPVICLMGPTAAGKTQLAVELVQQFPFAIVSVDSAMVYRGMDIGTAKPTADILQIAPHRLIDIHEPCEIYSAAQFCADALSAIKSILAENKIPLLVGGTMLYFRALQQGLAHLPQADAALRANILSQAKAEGWPALHARLARVDTLAAQRIHPHDSQRIQRALEVFELTGKNLTAWQQEGADGADFQFHSLIVAPADRAILHVRIAERFKQMLAHGLLEEVKNLIARGDLSLELPSMRSVGYRQVWEYLHGALDFTNLTERGIIATRQLAKRQLTWLRSWPNGIWFDSETQDLLVQIKKFLATIKI